MTVELPLDARGSIIYISCRASVVIFGVIFHSVSRVLPAYHTLWDFFW